eukprot:PhM_4_TR10066/c3_g2_i4/m.25766
MSYRRALEWLWQNDVRSRPGMSIDMYNTYADEKGPFMPFSSMQVLELALPSTVAASSSLTNVSEIGYYFLSDCSSLTSVDLSSLANVTEIGGFFLSHCSVLTTLDVSSFKKVRTIDGSFLDACSSLTCLHLSPLTSVNQIGGRFLACSALASVDLSPFTSVSQIGERFLTYCSSLTSVDA